MKYPGFVIAGGFSLVATILALPVVSGPLGWGVAEAAQLLDVDALSTGNNEQLDISGLLKVPEGHFEVNADDSVSLVPLYVERISKIAHGHKSLVTSATTSSGAYSTDGLASPHVQYPGINVTRVPARREARNRVFWLSDSGAWLALPVRGTSFVIQLSGSRGHFVQYPDSACVVLPNATHCR